MTRLSVNVDHVATLRQARRGAEPEPVEIALMAELAGADGITVHLREDRRHIQDRDLRLLRELVKTKLNLEMAATPEIIGIARQVKPDLTTLVPERRQEITTEGGLDVVSLKPSLREAIARLHEGSIPVSLFIDPELRQVEAAAEVGADCVEMNTGRYSEACTPDQEKEELRKVTEAAQLAAQLGLRVNAGHGLNYRNVVAIARIPEVEEMSIGHNLIARSIAVGIYQAVKEMIQLVKSP